MNEPYLQHCNFFYKRWMKLVKSSEWKPAIFSRQVTSFTEIFLIYVFFMIQAQLIKIDHQDPFLANYLMQLLISFNTYLLNLQTTRLGSCFSTCLFSIFEDYSPFSKSNHSIMFIRTDAVMRCPFNMCIQFPTSSNGRHQPMYSLGNFKWRERDHFNTPVISSLKECLMQSWSSMSISWPPLGGLI